MGGSGAQDFVLGGCLFEFAFQALVVGGEGGGALFEGRELLFEVFDVAFFALAECSLSVV